MEIYECNNCDKGTCYNNNNKLFCNRGLAAWKVAEGYSLFRDNSGIIVQPTLEKKLELMTFFEAWEKAKEGDMIKHLDGDLSVIKGSTPETFKIELGDIIECKWQVIPSASIVLDARGWVNKNIGKYWGPKHYLETENQFGVECFEAGEENQWLNHKDLREAAQYCFDCEHGTDEFEKLADALENLKPLEEK